MKEPALGRRAAISPMASLARSSRRCMSEKPSFIAKILCHEGQLTAFMLRRLYEYLLCSRDRQASHAQMRGHRPQPRGLGSMGPAASRGSDRLEHVAWPWSLAIYINDDSLETRQKMISYLSDLPALDQPARCAEGPDGWEPADRSLLVSLGYGGKREVTEAVRKLLVDVEAGILEPEEIDEGALETRLRFQQKPDLVIRAGGRQLSDFMIWQAAYSELYFTEVNWRFLRKVDFLRAIRDFQEERGDSAGKPLRDLICLGQALPGQNAQVLWRNPL